MQHHDDTIIRYVAKVAQQPDTRAVIVTGSVARGTPRPDSDVDVYLVVGHSAFQAAVLERRVSFVDADVATYEGGYVDVKVISEAVLTAAVERADEPTRASFLSAKVVHGATPDLHNVVREIPLLPAHEWERRALDHLATMRVQLLYFLPQGLSRRDPMLVRAAATTGVAAGSRALLALNRVLFQGMKYLRDTAEALEQRPREYTALADALVHEPSLPGRDAYWRAVEGLRPWELTMQETLAHYVERNELAWFFGAESPARL